MSHGILSSTDLPRLVEELTRRAEHHHSSGGEFCLQPRPAPETVIEVVEQLRALLFPGFFNGSDDLTSETVLYYVGATLERIIRPLKEQIQRGLCFVCNVCDPATRCEGHARQVTKEFLYRLPAVQRMLNLDAEAAYLGDPASISTDEVIFCYPGLHALTCQRLAHELHRLGVPIIPRMITEYAHGRTGIDIHPGAVLGERLFIDHGTGVVVGETCVIGNNVKIYQGVTLGAKSFPLDEKGNPIKGIARHPLIEDDVTIYAGATILGRVTIGRGSIIGGNVWLTRSVPAGARITQAHVREELFRDGAGI
ncbi:MAG: serine acetyltransferase [Acidobacteria bacterium]|nr:serine acetyltransferase [Acidobacteriota bacterium]